VCVVCGGDGDGDGFLERTKTVCVGVFLKIVHHRRNSVGSIARRAESRRIVEGLVKLGHHHRMRRCRWHQAFNFVFIYLFVVVFLILIFLKRFFSFFWNESEKYRRNKIPSFAKRENARAKECFWF